MTRPSGQGDSTSVGEGAPQELMRRGAAAMRVMQGEDPAGVAREFGISLDELESWRRHFLGDREGKRYRLKRWIGRFPVADRELKHLWYQFQIRSGRFGSPEPEFAALPQVVHEGDWVLDVGANVGAYTRRLSELVGPAGRVFALEPIAQTFSLLATNVADCSNVTLLNLAASDHLGIEQMVVPAFGSGLSSYANATILRSGRGVPVVVMPLDDFSFSSPIRFVKLDTEGHEAAALAGMSHLLTRDRPDVIVEVNTPDTLPLLTRLGYASVRLSNGATVFRAR